MGPSCISHFPQRVIVSLILLFAIVGCCYFQSFGTFSFSGLRFEAIRANQVVSNLKVAHTRDAQDEVQQDDHASGMPALPEHRRAPSPPDESQAEEKKSAAQNKGSASTEADGQSEKQAENQSTGSVKQDQKEEGNTDLKKDMDDASESQNKLPKADERVDLGDAKKHEDEEQRPELTEDKNTASKPPQKLPEIPGESTDPEQKNNEQFSPNPAVQANISQRLEISQRLSGIIKWQADHEKTSILSVNKTEVIFSSEFHEGRVVPGYFTFFIVSKDIQGQPRTSCTDAFFVTIIGKHDVRGTGNVTCDLEKAGRYEVRAMLPSAGQYNVNVTAVGTVESSICFELSAGKGLVAKFDVAVKSPPKRRGAVAAVSTSTCSAEAFYDGFYAPPAEEKHFFQRDGLAYAWNPAGPMGGEARSRCDWPAYWDLDRLKGSLGGKWIFFVGDSTLEEIAVAYMFQFYIEFNSSWNNPRCNCSNTKFPSQRIWDTGYVSPHLPRLSFYWIGNPYPCGNGKGLTTLDNDTVREDLRAIFGEHFLTKSSHQSEKKVDVLVFNSGLHDLSNGMPFDFPGYLSRLNYALGNFSQVAHRTVWKTISPKLRATTCKFSYGTQSHVDVMNAHATPLARSYGFQIADQVPLNLGLAEKIDGHHCRSNEPCRAFSSSLLNFMAPVVERTSASK